MQQRWPDRLWIVRHGESAGNVARDAAHAAGLDTIDIKSRDVDVPLSALGLQQAEALGRWFAQMPADARPDVILSSPYLRAQSTSQAIHDVGGIADTFKSVTVDERLREKEFGALDRLTKRGIEQHFPQEAASRLWLGKFYYRPPSGESWADVILRLRSVLDTVSLHYGGKRVLIVGHQVVVLCMRYLLEGLDEKAILAIDAEGDVANCSVTEYAFKPETDGSGDLVLRKYNFVAPLQREGAPVTAEPDANAPRQMKPVAIDPDYLRHHPLPKHEQEGSKELRGRVLIIAGSVEMPGAALLAAQGALRAGAGILQIATCRSAAQHLGMAMPEAMVIGCDETAEGGIAASAADKLGKLAKDSDAVLVGPGMLDQKAIAALTASLLRDAPDTVFTLDAAAFTTLDPSGIILTERSGGLVLTPHSGEMARFLELPRQKVDDDPVAAARQASDRLRAVVAMKGAETHVVSPGGDVACCRNGSIALATSGSGDALAGILAGLLARGTEPALAAAWAVYLHAEAGMRLQKRLGRIGLLAREIAGEVPAIMHELSGKA